MGNFCSNIQSQSAFSSNLINPVNGDTFICTFNLLGDATNPFEFLSKSDSSYMLNYKNIEIYAANIFLSHIEKIFSQLGPQTEKINLQMERLRNHCVNESIWSFFKKNILSNDNKILDKRLNMITMANAPLKDLDLTFENNVTQQWHLVSNWVDTFKQLLPYYERDANLFLWDMCCNVIVSQPNVIPSYQTICRTSIFNSNNVLGLTESLFKPIISNKKVIAGVQEFPVEGSEKCKTFTRYLNDNGFNVIASSNSVAIIYSSFLEKPIIKTNGDYTWYFEDGTVSKEKIINEINSVETMIQVIDANDGISEKDKNGLVGTTTKKTMIVDFSSLRVINIHAKEPKERQAASTLAKYIKTLSGSENWIALCDSNISSYDVGNEFKDQFDELVFPEPNVDTTSKHRSLLHGQCYDREKCLVTVKASKDKIIVSSGLSFSNGKVSPDVNRDDVNITLPTIIHPSDHCIVSGMLGKIMI